MKFFCSSVTFVKDTDTSMKELDTSETEVIERILAAEKVSVVYSSTGYEADADVN